MDMNLEVRGAVARGTTGQQRLLVFGCALIAALAVSCSRHSGMGPPPATGAVPPQVTLRQSSAHVASHDFIELELAVTDSASVNPFTDAFVSGRFWREQAGEAAATVVEGFCDSADGRTYRVRYMPSEAGEYRYAVTYWRDNRQLTLQGKFVAVGARRRGMVRVDSQYPWHFVWQGTGEHYYLNGTTAFLLMGWEDEAVIRGVLDRFHLYDVNRVRVLLDGRTDHFWTEPVYPGRGFNAFLNPWESRRPADILNPGFDYARFNVGYWQRFERMLSYARDQDIVISVVFGWNDTEVHPQAFSADERRYLRYAIARLAAYSNVTWDLGDDLNHFRSDVWTHETGTFLHGIDPYKHLATSHPGSSPHQDRQAEWFGMTSYQMWRRPMHAWMLEQRVAQSSLGRIIPQVNEEYGYEDHYPKWAPYSAPAASGDENRRVAWQIAMAGAYQTTGETAKRGTGIAPDTGGGFVNGRGDATMTMLRGYAHLVHFFSALEWWKLEPRDELVGNGAYCLAEPGRAYVIYLPHGGSVTAALAPGDYLSRWFNPRTGEYATPIAAQGPQWRSTAAPDGGDWVIELIRKK